MRPTFNPRAVNGPFEDPALYVRLPWMGRALLFDCGEIGALSPGELQKITDIFITHTHVDHFIGFDALVRALLRRPLPLRVFGPETIAEQVEAKLGGYTWNLIKDYPLELEVYAIGESSIGHVSFHAKNSFRRVEHDTLKFDGTVHEETAFKIKAARLEHGVSSIGYSLKEDVHLNIDKSALGALGLHAGAWLTGLKQAVREGRPDEDPIEVPGGESMPLGRLKDIVRTTRGQKITYVMDASPTKDNARRIVELAEGSDVLFCEAAFGGDEIELAAERSHLTASLAGRIAREAGVRKLVVMHFSQRYRSDPERLINEAMQEFHGGPGGT